MSPNVLVYSVSDATGETALQACKAALAQFGQFEESSIRSVSHVLSEEDLRRVVKQAKDANAILAYTLVGPELRSRIKELVEEHEVKAVDLLGTLIARFARHLDRKPLAVPGLGHELDDDYFRRVDAVEFAVANDDGREPRNLRKADIVIVGISRTGKTPLSNYIAHRGYKVANVPLVLDVNTPKELEDVDPRRVFGLSIDPAALMKIRQSRMETLRMEAHADYGDIRHIRREAAWARKVFESHPEWTVLNMTRKAIEETASKILELYRATFEPAEAATDPATKELDA